MFIAPTFSVAAIIGIALPLFLVTMASQNVPGVAVLRASGYAVPISPVIGWIGIVNLLLAPFGAFALNLAAITAAICMGREAHEDASRRYVAAMAAGIFYLIVALLGTIGGSLAAALREESEREPAMVAFLVTASGVSLVGIGSAFWGLVAGVVALLASRRPDNGRTAG